MSMSIAYVHPLVSSDRFHVMFFETLSDDPCYITSRTYVHDTVENKMFPSDTDFDSIENDENPTIFVNYHLQFNVIDMNWVIEHGELVGSYNEIPSLVRDY